MPDHVDAKMTGAGENEAPAGPPIKKQAVSEGGKPVAKPVPAQEDAAAQRMKKAAELRKIEVDKETAHQEKIKKERATDRDFSSKQYLYTYNVGQGDSALYVNYEKKCAILIDAGSSKQDIEGATGLTAEQTTTIIPTGDASISDKRISDDIISIPTEIEKLWVIVTHADADHYNWLNSLAPAMKARFKERVTFLAHSKSSVIAAAGKKGTQKYGSWLESITKNGWTHTETDAPTGVIKANWKDAKSKNNMSYVSLIPLDASTAYLNMGDAEDPAEEGLKERINKELLGQGIDEATKKVKQYSTLIVKAGHHGSKTSSTEALLDVVKRHVEPNGDLIVIFSVAKHPYRKYKHPAKDTIDNWKKLGTEGFHVTIYCTHETHVITTSCANCLVQTVPENKNIPGVGKADSFLTLLCAKKQDKENKTQNLVKLDDNRIWLQEAATTGNALYEAVAIALGQPASHVQKLRMEAGNWCRNHMSEDLMNWNGNGAPPTNWDGEIKKEDVAKWREDVAKWFETDMNWGGDLGDLAPWVLANAIPCEIVIVAEKATYRFVPANPGKEVPVITIFYTNMTYTVKPQEPHKGHESRMDWPGTTTTKDEAVDDVKPGLELGVKRSKTDIEEQAKKIADAKKKPAS